MAFPAALSLSLTSPSSISSSCHPHSHHLLSSPSPCIHSNVKPYSYNYRGRSITPACSPYYHYRCFRVWYRFSASADGDDKEDEAEDCSFDEAVVLFNTREYYKCHDFLESLWNNAEEPSRTLIHGILQCAVGFHHLFNQNHRGAMMELGEGLCKLRKMHFKHREGPFYQFEQEISAALDFIYQTQIELAACTEDLCVTMDQSEKSYQLLGGYAAGQLLYTLQTDPNDYETTYIVFSPHSSYASQPPKVKLPTLNASTQNLMACEYR